MVMADKVIVFEFNVVDIVKDGNTAIAVSKERNYAEGYRYMNRPIYLVGIGFSKEKRNIINF